jgi:hypothetical protein
MQDALASGQRRNDQSTLGYTFGAGHFDDRIHMGKGFYLFHNILSIF